MISKQEVEHIAKLARLELTKAELEKMQGELAAILRYIEMLNKVDVSGISATSHSADLENIMRNDTPEPADAETVGGAKEQFPNREEDFLKVKGVL